LFAFDELWVSDVPAAADRFSRSVVDGWGRAETGGAWTLSGAAVDFDVDGSAGTVRTAVAASRSALLSSVAARDIDLLFRVRTDRVATGGGQFAYVIARRMGDGSEYRPRLRFAPTGGVYLTAMKVAGGVETALGPEVLVPGLAHAPGRIVWLRALVSGASPTSIRLRAWTNGHVGPVSWQWTGSDSTAVLQDPGSLGVRTYVSGSATNGGALFSFEDVWARRP
jgi:hypothetical protein